MFKEYITKKELDAFIKRDLMGKVKHLAREIVHSNKIIIVINQSENKN